MLGASPIKDAQESLGTRIEECLFQEILLQKVPMH